MDNCMTNGSEVWSEFFASAGLAGALALCSDTLNGRDTDTVKAINNFAVANNYVRPNMIRQLEAIIHRALWQASGSAD